MELEKELYTRQEVEQLLESFKRDWLQEVQGVSAQARGNEPGLYADDHALLFKNIFDTILDAILIIDNSGKIIIVNPATCKMFGYDADEMVGGSINMIMTQEYSGLHDQLIQQYLQGRNPKIIGVGGRRFPALRKDGSIFPMEIAVTRSQITGSTYFIGVIHDISSRVQEEEELRKARDEALDAAKIKSDLLSLFSHEIRTPMNGIIGCSELLKMTSLDEEQKSYINVVHESANGLLTLLNDIVDLSRLETGRIRINALEFEPRHLLESVCSLFQAQAEMKGLSLSFHVDASLPEVLIGDEGHLRQILINLIQNALKFTQEGGIRIGIKAYSADEAGVVTEFYVEDTGIGIAPEEQESIFASFVQGEHAKSVMLGGLGLGLSICKRLVELMHGEMLLRSEPGKGSRFYFRIPLSLSQ